MNPPTFIYCRTYIEYIVGGIPIYHHYIGITKDMKRRMKEHEKGTTRTTNRFKEAYHYVSTRYKIIKDLQYEKTFKKYSTFKKRQLIIKWKRWAG